ncbi:hypothetical protein JOC34_000528 [Virgibacillus halotolerans]|uniref:hypothetical protein n=1 Tax=Virgibacillus halotolerans TaxID=1071053 RepID=UPI0019607093|nr:hypothetical protein [Virgibacillus halotolerans]MBM7598171.1 hypothetical protein [Virgibacillus halotolerans]
MIYLIVDKRDEQIIKISDYEKYNNKLESLGSYPDCNYFHMMGLNEADCSEMRYLLMDSGEATYKDFKFVEIN